MRIALCQLHVTADKPANIATATAAVREAAGNGAKLVVLPEMWNCPYSNDSFPVYAEDIDGGEAPSVSALQVRGAGLRGEGCKGRGGTLRWWVVGMVHVADVGGSG